MWFWSLCTIFWVVNHLWWQLLWFVDELSLCLEARLRWKEWELVDCLINVFALQDSNTFLATLDHVHFALFV